jgi:membrane associated rhomboid family serine protease|tara:strand:+ start:7448 stop:8272 length:825 start_codon:yes stop_codon:yes gene_type:complete
MFRYNLFPKKKGFLSGMSITNKLILINVALFFVSYFIVRIYGEAFFTSNFALTPSLILSGEKLWTIFTSMFLHAGFFHIFANMFSLFFIGNFLEKILGKKRFLLIYLVAGLIGGLFFVSSGMIFSDNVPGIGASGAVFGVLGVLAILVPYSKIYLIAGPLILIILSFILGPFVPADLFSFFNLVVNILIIVMIFSILSFNPLMRKFAVPVELPMWVLPIVAIVPLVLIGFIPGIPELPIGNSAHIGGLIAGIFYGVYLRNKFPRKTKMLRGYFK